MTAEEKEKAYWLQRFTDQTAAVHDEVDRATEELRQAWAAIIQDMENEINGWYVRFAAEQGLTMAEAKKALTTKELAGLKMSLREFEKLAKGNANGKWEKELSAASARVRISRLEAMELGIRNYLWKAYQNTHSTAEKTLRDAYTSEYYHNTYEMQRAAGKFTPMQEIPEDIINAALSHPWAADGREWSDRIWDNREQVTKEMQGELVRSIIQGKGAYESSVRLAKKMGTGQYQAVRLIQTEATYITTRADVDSFGAMGIEKVQYVATLEAHTCGTCGSLDDKVMNRKDAIPGISAPPMHPNCRCTLVPYFEDNVTRRWMKDPDTFERKTTGDMDFNEWKAQFVKDKKAQAVKVSSKKAPAAPTEPAPEPVHNSQPLFANQRFANPQQFFESPQLAAITPPPAASNPPPVQEDQKLEASGFTDSVKNVARKVKSKILGKKPEDEKFVPYEQRSYPILTMKDFTKMSQAHNKKLDPSLKNQIASHPNLNPKGGASLGYIGTRNYAVINGYLRGDPDYAKVINIGDAEALDNKKTIDAMRKVISSHTLGRDCTLTRYVNGSELYRLWKVKNPYPYGDEKNIPNNFFELRNHEKYVRPIIDELKKHIGETISDKGFLSTSVVPSKNIMQDKLVVYEIKAPKETHCYITKNRKESECILGENTKLVIEKVEYISLVHKIRFTLRVEL